MSIILHKDERVFVPYHCLFLEIYFRGNVKFESVPVLYNVIRPLKSNKFFFLFEITPRPYVSVSYFYLYFLNVQKT